MLKTPLLHPQILAAFGRAGHSSKILISDGNYPHATKRGPNADLVFLNLAPGLLTVTQVLETVLASVPIEAVEVMDYARTGPYALRADPDIWSEFRTLLKTAHYDLELQKVERFAFYKAAQDPDVCLTIATGEQRIYANVLLTIGVVKPQ